MKERIQYEPCTRCGNRITVKYEISDDYPDNMIVFPRDHGLYVCNGCRVNWNINEENEKLKEKLAMNERMQKFTNTHIKEESKKVKHLFPLENTAGYGQLCDKLLHYEKALKEIIETYEYGRPDNDGEVMVEVEDTCDAIYQIAVNTLKED